ncbi:hypothetical protein Hdeb2414_s0023g00636191 [Helianthus debilis subsp. tardiflorus]
MFTSLCFDGGFFWFISVLVTHRMRPETSSESYGDLNGDRFISCSDNHSHSLGILHVYSSVITRKRNATKVDR